MNMELVSMVLALPESERRWLFKPVQVRVLEKVARGEPLGPNERRYLRGGIRRKMGALTALGLPKGTRPEPREFLGTLGEYYITGHEALKLNGFGWYFESKRVDVVNTRLAGELELDGISFRFRRVRSLGSDVWRLDPSSGLRVATNERVLADARQTGDLALERTWLAMLERYGGLFVAEPERYRHMLRPKQSRPMEYYGV